MYRNSLFALAAALMSVGSFATTIAVITAAIDSHIQFA